MKINIADCFAPVTKESKNKVYANCEYPLQAPVNLPIKTNNSEDGEEIMPVLKKCAHIVYEGCEARVLKMIENLDKGSVFIREIENGWVKLQGRLLDNEKYKKLKLESEKPAVMEKIDGKFYLLYYI